ncbi:MAG TPA: cyclopropane-fatty-acyl-phospholipid synthase family protein [Solirubrobacteraceae bacterium]|jgi:cyclopropane-fatty-acyl-phospholipid synthase
MSGPPLGRSAAVQRACRRLFSSLLRHLEGGSLLIVEDEQPRLLGEGAPAATVHILSRRLWPLLLRGSVGLADGYAEGLWDSPDVTKVIALAARNAARVDAARRRLAPIASPLQRARSLLQANTRRRNRRDIEAHYDLGDDLFELMLDPTMMYSCAVFEREDMTLEQASLAKLERVCDKLELEEHHRVLEIGGGWGGFALHAARTRGCHVTTTTISRHQYERMRREVARQGLGQHITVLGKDYRDLAGSYDRLVSIEMIEAVGWQHFGQFFAKCSQLLAPDGAMLLQAITIADGAYEVEKASKSFIKTYIFPNGCLPSLSVIKHCVAERTDMGIVDFDEIGAHYVETLKRWRERFTANAERLAELGYDSRFRRLWTLYLAYCEAGFAERRISDWQLLLAKPGRMPAA